MDKGEQFLERITQREKMQMIPRYISDTKGLVTVDVTWGEIQPIQAAEGVQTIGECEIIEQLEKGLPVVGVRAPGTRHGVGIPGTSAIPLSDIVDRMDELDRSKPTVFFCNGPQCPQSQKAINMLLEAGYPAEKIWYYRGGMHDWITLGLPVTENGE